MNDAELSGKVDGFVAVLENETNAPVLAEKKVPVTDIVNALTKKKDAMVAKSTEQDTLKASLKSATQEATQASSILYDEFSSRIDAASGLVGKKTPLGQQILQLRSDLLRASRSNGTAAASNNEAGVSTPIPLSHAA